MSNLATNSRTGEPIGLLAGWGRYPIVVAGFRGVDRSGFVPLVNGAANVEDFVTRQERGESQWAAQLTLKYTF